MMMGRSVAPEDGLQLSESTHVAWNFPGSPGRRYPIVANNVPRYVYTFHPPSASEPVCDTLHYFLKRIQEGNFTIVRTSLSPSRSPIEQFGSYENFIKALHSVNSDNDSKQLWYLAYDYRFNNPADYKVAASCPVDYDADHFYGFTIDEPRERDFSRLSIWCEIFGTKDQTSWYTTNFCM